MKWAAITLLALMTACAPAYADFAVGHPPEYEVLPMTHPQHWGLFYLPVEGEEHFAVIRYRNTTQNSQKMFHNFDFDSPFGPVSVTLFITPNLSCAAENCPDHVYVRGLPTGVTAEPMELVVDEKWIGEIKLFPYNGF